GEHEASGFLEDEAVRRLAVEEDDGAPVRVVAGHDPARHGLQSFGESCAAHSRKRSSSGGFITHAFLPYGWPRSKSWWPISWTSRSPANRALPASESLSPPRSPRVTASSPIRG